MLKRRGLFSTLACAGLLAGCGADSPPAGRRDAESARLAEGLATAPDPDYEALLPPPGAADPLAPLGAALRALQGGAQGRALVLVLGDSHIAFPRMAERLREHLQARFGAIGPGRMPPGRANRSFVPAGLALEQEGEWTSAHALRAATPGPFGLTGYRLTGERAGDRIGLRSSDLRGFDRLHLALHCGPDSGSFRVLGAGISETPRASRTPAPRLRLIRLDLSPGTREVALELVGDGPVALLGWGIDRRGSGVLVESFGINGATLATLDNRAPDILAAELAVAPPALIILEYGTNEATDRDFDPAAYALALSRRIAALRAASPRSGILLMGAPDAGRPIRRGRGACPVAPLTALEAVRATQRQVAARERVGFFDWSAEVTQDPCRLPGLVRAGLMRPDLVHFTADGYRQTADRLHAHLLRGAGLGPAGA
ncbi:GDSL-type esterase/lipase family protein [Falsiroseomonas sp.]|uniref:GDSL-type esterase/lipase family protein n=1 Tax=Falsiroseomonas sp. TaxID=2870721 RepID=UPI003F6ECABC